MSYCGVNTSSRWSVSSPVALKASPPLPYAMRGGLATDEGIPLVRFAHAAVRTLVTEPGWTPSQPQGKAHDERWRTDIETMMRGAVPY